MTTRRRVGSPQIFTGKAARNIPRAMFTEWMHQGTRLNIKYRHQESSLLILTARDMKITSITDCDEHGFRITLSDHAKTSLYPQSIESVEILPTFTLRKILDRLPNIIGNYPARKRLMEIVIIFVLALRPEIRAEIDTWPASDVETISHGIDYAATLDALVKKHGLSFFNRFATTKFTHSDVISALESANLSVIGEIRVTYGNQPEEISLGKDWFKNIRQELKAL